MNRRHVLKLLFAAPVAAIAAKFIKPAAPESTLSYKATIPTTHAEPKRYFLSFTSPTLTLYETSDQPYTTARFYQLIPASDRQGTWMATTGIEDQVTYSGCHLIYPRWYWSQHALDPWAT